MTAENDLRQFGRLICEVSAGKTMSREEACNAYKQVILNEQPELQQGAFLMAHFTRGETIEELSGAWDALDRYDTGKINPKIEGGVCDIVGTGSDSLKTVNCSTPASLIAAAAGLSVAKKGAGLVTGVSGASDIFKLFGLDLTAPLSVAEKALEEIGYCYLPGEAFLRSGWARLIQSMRFTSTFNIIGPLTRPCEQNNSIVIGAYSPDVCDQLIAILKEINMEKAIAPYGMVTGKDAKWGMDEFSLSGETRVVELKNGEITTYTVTPETFDVASCDFSKIASKSTAQENCDAILDVLNGNYDSELANFFCINAAAALYVAGDVEDYKAGFEKSRHALTSGAARQKLQQLIEFNK